MNKRLIAYMTSWCPNCLDARRALEAWHVPYEYIDIERDRAAAARVRMWTGFESVPTFVVAEGESLDPFQPPAPLAQGASPRGVDRGSMLTEPSREQLRDWLIRHGLLKAE